ncbi:parvalbumin alpha-like [Amphiura filiformis]|uniref:parvalbumin alpha-like n=1 Tax=Amphiura filiformis TaxID=82378 RepID=UPI003B213CC7
MAAAERGPSPSSIRQLFEACDVNGNGFIEPHELAQVCEDLEDDEVEGLFVALDQDGDGRISLVDFTTGFESVSQTLLSLGKRRSRMIPSMLSADPGTAFADFVARIGRSDWALFRSSW